MMSLVFKKIQFQNSSHIGTYPLDISRKVCECEAQIFYNFFDPKVQFLIRKLFDLLKLKLKIINCGTLSCCCKGNADSCNQQHKVKSCGVVKCHFFDKCHSFFLNTLLSDRICRNLSYLQTSKCQILEVIRYSFLTKKIYFQKILQFFLMGL